MSTAVTRGCPQRSGIPSGSFPQSRKSQRKSKEESKRFDPRGGQKTLPLLLLCDFAALREPKSAFSSRLCRNLLTLISQPTCRKMCPKNTPMTENEISRIIVDSAFKIHTTLGPGLYESVYEATLAYELQQRGCCVVRQRGIPVLYEDVKLNLGFRADIIGRSQSHRRSEIYRGSRACTC